MQLNVSTKINIIASLELDADMSPKPTVNIIVVPQ